MNTAAFFILAVLILAGALLGPAANIVFLYGVAGWYADGMGAHVSRLFLDTGSEWVAGAFAFSMTLQTIHMGLRMRFSARIYGWKFASLAPARAALGAVINFLATASAIHRYFRARWNRQTLTWLKTDHAYPSREALMVDRRRLGDLLVGSQYVLAADVESALQTQPSGVRIGEYLIHLGKLTEGELYECLSLQQNVSFQNLERAQVSRPVTRALPAEVSRKWRVLGYKVASGQLFVASPDVPSGQMSEDLRRFSSLEIRFHLITPGNFEALQQEFLPPAKSKAAS